MEVLAFGGAERDADADPANSLLDTVREDSVESESGEEKRDDRKERHHESSEPWLAGGCRQDLGHRPDVRQRQSSIDGCYRRARRCGDSSRIPWRADDKCHRTSLVWRPRRLGERDVNGGRGRLAGANRQDITHDSDDLDGMVRLLRVVANRPSDRIVTGPVETRGGLVDDCDEWLPGHVTFGEKSSALQRNAEGSKHSWRSHQVARVPRRCPWQGFGLAFTNEAVRRSCRRQRKV